MFAQIAIPVGLVSPFDDGELRLRQLCREHQVSLSRPAWCEQHERALEQSEIIRAFEVAPGQFVVLEDDELEAIAPDEGARAIEISAFVEAGAVDPLLPRRTYYLAPGEQPLMCKAYGLLSAAMRESETVAIARFAAWRAEHVCAIERRHGDDKTLVLRVLRPHVELRSSREIDRLLAGTEPGPEEQKLARELIGNLTRQLSRVDLSDRSGQRLRGLIETKLAGREVVRVEAESKMPPAAPADLAAALRKSLQATARKRRGSQADRSKKPTSSRS